VRAIALAILAVGMNIDGTTLYLAGHAGPAVTETLTATVMWGLCVYCLLTGK
jgi:hypothetical protein